MVLHSTLVGSELHFPLGHVTAGPLLLPDTTVDTYKIYDSDGNWFVIDNDTGAMTFGSAGRVQSYEFKGTTTGVQFDGYAYFKTGGQCRIIMEDRGSNPTAVAGLASLYAKTITGVTHLYVQDDDGSVYQLGAASIPITLADNAAITTIIAVADGAKILRATTTNFSEAIDIGDTANSGLLINLTGGTRLTTALIAGGQGPIMFGLTGRAHTALTASTEFSPVVWDLSQTVQWSTGALTTERFFRILAPTIGFVGASTCTVAATVAISSNPIAGTNATLTRSYSLHLEGAVAGRTRLGLGTFNTTVAVDPVIEWNTGNGSTAFNGTATYTVTAATFTSTARAYLNFAGARLFSQGNGVTSLCIGSAADDDGGANAVVYGNSGYAVGGATAIGNFAWASGSSGSIVINGATTSGSSSTGSGASSLTIAPGAGCSNTHARCILVGASLTSHADDTCQLKTLELIIGNGDQVATPSAAIYRGTDASGTDKAAASLTIRPGRSTGTGAGASLILQTTPTGGASNSTLQTPVDRITISQSGAITFGGQVTLASSGFAGAIVMNAELTPAQLTANQNNYAPTNFATAFLIRQGVDATGRTITGLAGGAAGRIVVISNIETGGTNIITITNEDGASTAANRFTLPSAVSVLIGPGESIMFLYDGTSSRWRPVSQF
jgi:hypothetical protein